MTENKGKGMKLLRENWGSMSLYERFEYLICAVISFVIVLVILVALIRLSRTVFDMLVMNALNPLDEKVFQTVFGMILTLFIAMEFRHSIINVLERTGHVVQVRSVILIALLAIARKFIIIDTKETEATMMAALGLVALTLGVVYWLLKFHDRQPRELPKA